MKLVEPEVRLIAQPDIDFYELREYLTAVGGGLMWAEDRAEDDYASDSETLIEAAGRICYRSWEPGLNPNVTRVRTDKTAYLQNILASAHGSVLEHAQFTFVFRHVSRVVTHELVRHRAGTAISQESMRYVRMDDIPMWLPEWAKQDEELMTYIKSEVARAEEFQRWVARRYQLDDPESKFVEKKKVTSFMRRFAPGGHATDMVWSANIRALRHIIETRTAEGAEEEIRLVFGRVADIMIAAAPDLFGDFQKTESGAYVPKWRKV